jgi:two-component system LytT family response regulator
MAAQSFGCEESPTGELRLHMATDGNFRTGMAVPQNAIYAVMRIAIKVNGGIRFVNPGEVVAVLAEGNYVLLQQQTSSYLLRESMSVLAATLEPFGFIRIHRSVIVNSTFVEEIKPRATGEYLLRVKGGKEYTVTRTYKDNLKSLAEFWIGTGRFFLDHEQ